MNNVGKFEDLGNVEHVLTCMRKLEYKTEIFKDEDVEASATLTIGQKQLKIDATHIVEISLSDACNL